MKHAVFDIHGSTLTCLINVPGLINCPMRKIAKLVDECTGKVFVLNKRHDAKFAFYTNSKSKFPENSRRKCAKIQMKKFESSKILKLHIRFFEIIAISLVQNCLREP